MITDVPIFRVFFSGLDLPIGGDFPYRDLFSAKQLQLAW